MTEQKDDGGPAFPVWELNGQGQQELTCTGMTLRDYFAAEWMNGYIASPIARDMPLDKAAAFAYEMADAMLKARKA